jgi:IS30 family transposase
LHIEARKQVGHWECDTVIGASHKGAVATMVERKSGYAVMAKVKKDVSISKLSYCGQAPAFGGTGENADL